MGVGLAEKRELSPIDLKILKLITRQGIIPEHQIAKKLKLNPSTVNYKIKKMQEDKIISDYTYRFNYEKLGLKTQAWIFLSLNANFKNSDEVFEELFKFGEVFGVFVITGADDLALKVFTETVEDATKFLMNLENRYRELIITSSIYFVTESYKFHHTILDSEKESTILLNKTDLKIIQFLKYNPNNSIKELAKELNIHRNTASNRIAKLIEEQVILKKSARVTPPYYRDIGIAFRAIVLIDAKTGEIDNLARKLAELDEVHEVFSINAKHDILAIVRTEDLEAFYYFNRKLYGNPELSKLLNSTNSSIILKGKTQRPECITKVLEKKLENELEKNKLIDLKETALINN